MILFIGCIIIPVFMFILLICFSLKPPQKINSWYGFRTKRAMINKESWNYANKLFGKISFYITIGVFILSLLAYIYLTRIGALKQYIAFLMYSQMIAILLPSIIIVNIKLKKFLPDKN